MISNQFSKQLPFSTFINNAMKSKVKDIQDEQLYRYRSIATDRSGKTRATLNSLTNDTTMLSDRFIIKYPSSIQFLDMRFGAKGSEKLFHEFLYLRVVYGNLFGGSKRKKNKNKSKSFNTIVLAEIHRRYEEKIQNEINNIIENG